ncbi:DUF86 domain-containing protein [bacterium]|nr:DUF86 domain-containing protein [bacterium]
MSRSALEYVRHMLDEAEYLLAQSKGLTHRRFARNDTLKRAFVRSIEVIGEASKQIPDDLKRKYSHLEWRAMAGMRDRLIHDYMGVDYDLVWDVVINKIPDLHRELQSLFEAESAEQ